MFEACSDSAKARSEASEALSSRDRAADGAQSASTAESRSVVTKPLYRFPLVEMNARQLASLGAARSAAALRASWARCSSAPHLYDFEYSLTRLPLSCCTARAQAA